MREKRKITEIEKALRKKFTKSPVPLGKEICEKQLFHLVDRMQNIEVNHDEIDQFLPTVYKKLEWLEREDLIKHFVSLEFNRFIDYYKNMPDLNIPEEDRRKKRANSGTSNSNYAFTSCRINIGRKEGIQPKDIINLVGDATRKRNIEIGRIKLFDKFTIFEIDSKYEEKVINSLNKINFFDRKIVAKVAAPDNNNDRKSRNFKQGRGNRNSRDHKRQNTERRKKVRNK